jgi:hypothetical protein
MIERLTEAEALRVNGHLVTARDLAAARQQLAHDGAYLPTWDELEPSDQARASIVAAAWLRSLRIIIETMEGS